MDPLLDSELEDLRAESEVWMPQQATWMVWGSTGRGAYGGDKVGWLATPDPLTNQPTIPCRINHAPRVVVDTVIGGEADKHVPPFMLTVPERIHPKLRDQFIVDDGHTYEVIVEMDAPSYSLSNTAACRRVS